MFIPRIALLVPLALLLVSTPASAHFPWLAADKEGKVSYFFGENTADRNYSMPDSIAKAEIHMVKDRGKAHKVAVKKVENDVFVGLVSEEPVGPHATLVSKVTYGLFRGGRLDYYAAHHGGKLPTSRDAYKSSKSHLDLHAQLVDTARTSFKTPDC